DYFKYREETLYIYGKCQCAFEKGSRFGHSALKAHTAPFGGIKPTPPVTTQSSGLFGIKPMHSPPVTTQSSGLFGIKPMHSPPVTTQSTMFGSDLFGGSDLSEKPLFNKGVNKFGSTVYNNCQHCNNKDQNNIYTPPDYCFCNVILEGELDLNDFVNLQVLHIEGSEHNKEQQQKLTKLKIERCIELTSLTISHTTLGYLSFGSKPKLERPNFVGNKRLIFCDSVLRDQVERLTSLIRATKVISFGDLKLELKKIEEENFEYQVDVMKSQLDEGNQLWLESLVEAQQEVLQNNSTYARKQLEKCKKKLTEVLTAEEIQDILGKKVEINELGIQLNKLNKLSLSN
ncbi:6253_t:CDS:2, partial [Racocetra fulgida]